jgi:hypothetical protein
VLTFFVLWLLLLYGRVWATVTSNSVVLPQTPQLGVVQLTNASGTTPATLYTGATNATKCVGAIASSTDTSGRDVSIFLIRGATTYLLTTVTVAAGSGYAGGTPPVALMTAAVWPGLPVDQSGTPYFYLASGDLLKVGTTTTITAGKLVGVTIVCADF